MLTYFKDWTRFEKIWLAGSTLTLLVLEIIWHDNTLGFIAALTGIVNVVLVAKGKISNYYWGMINTAVYAWVAYSSYHLYGEAQLNAFFYFPTQFIGLYLWLHHRKRQGDAISGEDIYAKRLSLRTRLIGVPVLLAVSAGYILFLHAINAAQAGLDGVAVVISVTAQILMLLRYTEQWVLWIVVNVITITLWSVTLITQHGNDWALLVMWIAYLVNSVYGYVNWRRLSAPAAQSDTFGAAAESVAERA